MSLISLKLPTISTNNPSSLTHQMYTTLHMRPANNWIYSYLSRCFPCLLIYWILRSNTPSEGNYPANIHPKAVKIEAKPRVACMFRPSLGHLQVLLSCIHQAVQRRMGQAWIFLKSYKILTTISNRFCWQLSATTLNQ